MSRPVINKLCTGIAMYFIHGAVAETTQETIQTFEWHTRSAWLNQLNKQAEAITRNPDSAAVLEPNLMSEKPSDSHHRQKLESYYQNEDFDGLQSFGEHRAQELETEQSPEGEAWRIVNQSPDRYYPDANEHSILKPVELSLNALQHPNTWSKQKHWPTDSLGNPVYDSALDGKSEMSATIAQLRQHFKGCDYQKKLVLKPDRQVSSPNIKECSRVLVTDDQVTLHRQLKISPFLTYVSGSELSGLQDCDGLLPHEGCLELRLGKGQQADNYYRCHCCIKEEHITVRLNKPRALSHAQIWQARWDDRLQIWTNGHNVWQSNKDFPPETGGRCERDKNFFLDDPVPLNPSLFHSPDHLLTFNIRTSVGDEGEGYALLRLYFDPNRLVDDDRWSPSSALEQLATMKQWHQDGLCHLEYHCLEHLTEAEHSIHGKVITLASLSPEIPADCKTVQANANCVYYKTPERNSPPDDCAALANDPNCQFLDRQCLGERSGICYTSEERYDCGYTGNLNRISIEESILCEGQPMQCMMGECQANIAEADNSDFASAVSGLHAAKHMAHDMTCQQDGSGCHVFSGSAYSCKKGLFNMVDCCHLPTQINFASYMNLLLMGYLFDKSSIHLQSNYPNALTGPYQKMREPLIRGINQLSRPVKTLWSDMALYMEDHWDKLTEKL